jgi:ubiquinone/menaquinone biosynthesis C-methylase UbiE
MGGEVIGGEPGWSATARPLSRFARRHGRPQAVFERVAALASPQAPNQRLAVARYRRHAPTYENDTALGDVYRRLAVAALSPRRGEVVADVGCGTGRNFPLVQEGIGPDGQLIGVDLCPQMLARAEALVRHRGWRNVTLIASPAEKAAFPAHADAALFCGAHDVMRSRPALESVIRQLRPGARVVAGGPKWAPPWSPWAPVTNLWTWQLNRRYVTTWEGFGRPWTVLARLIPDLDVWPVFFGGGYLASGTLPRTRAGPNSRARLRAETGASSSSGSESSFAGTADMQLAGDTRSAARLAAVPAFE